MDTNEKWIVMFGLGGGQGAAFASDQAGPFDSRAAARKWLDEQPAEKQAQVVGVVPRRSRS